MTPPRPTNHTLQHNSNLEREPLVANFPLRSQCPPQPESDCFGEQTLRPRRRSTGETVLPPDYIPPTSTQQPSLSTTPARPHGQHFNSDPSYVDTHTSNSISTHSQVPERAARSLTPPPKCRPSGGLMVTPNRPRASSLSSSRTSSGGRSVICGEPTKTTGSPCEKLVRVSNAYFDGRGELFEGICWQHNPSYQSYRDSSASPRSSPKQGSRTTPSAFQNSPITVDVNALCDGSECTKNAKPALAIGYRQMQDENDNNDKRDMPIKQFCLAHLKNVLERKTVFPISRVLSRPVEFDGRIISGIC